MNMLRCLALGVGGTVSVLVLAVAIAWGVYEDSVLRPGSGFQVPGSLYGYNVVITGSTSGIGFEAALEFYKLSAHVIVHSSNQQRAEKSAGDIERLGASGQGLGKVTPMAANLADFPKVTAFSEKLRVLMPRVDVLILNACRMYGLAPFYGDGTLMKQPASAFPAPSGHDSVLAVNHMGHYLLTELLLPSLRHGAPIVIMTAIGAWDSSHERIFPPWGYLGHHKMYPTTANDKRIIWESKGLQQHAFYAYHDSKYANICFGRWLRRRLGRNATVIMHDPGYVVTTPMLNRDSTTYTERLTRSVVQTKLFNWHAPVEWAGRNLLEVTFLTRRPIPDVVSSYFMPRQVVSWWAPHSWEGRRPPHLFWIAGYEKLTWGLHSTIGPQCDRDVQDWLMWWSSAQVGLRKS